MDKLKAALSGRETLNNEDEERGFVSQVIVVKEFMNMMEKMVIDYGDSYVDHDTGSDLE